MSLVPSSVTLREASEARGGKVWCGRLLEEFQGLGVVELDTCGLRIGGEDSVELVRHSLLSGPSWLQLTSPVTIRESESRGTRKRSLGITIVTF